MVPACRSTPWQTTGGSSTSPASASNSSSVATCTMTSLAMAELLKATCTATPLPAAAAEASTPSPSAVRLLTGTTRHVCMPSATTLETRTGPPMTMLTLLRDCSESRLYLKLCEDWRMPSARECRESCVTVACAGCGSSAATAAAWASPPGEGARVFTGWGPACRRHLTSTTVEDGRRTWMSLEPLPLFTSKNAAGSTLSSRM
mmetsp:Transcript_2859/g.8845  ORF Transcript_2859/g.8845 Transcript_2859/m.8845 type:complete len:203 (+) Transcript_2859:1182-1790(+)